METQKTTLQKVFDLYVDTYVDDRKPLNIPFWIGDYAYATDRHVMVRCHKSLIDFEINYPHKPVEADAIYKQMKREPRLLNISRDTFADVPMIKENILIAEADVCEECGGCGVVDWEYENFTLNADCPVCDGSGSIGEDKFQETGNLIYDECDVLLNDAVFDIVLVDKLLKTSEFLGEKIYFCGQESITSPAFFMVGDCEIVLMPFAVRTDETQSIDITNSIA